MTLFDPQNHKKIICKICLFIFTLNLLKDLQSELGLTYIFISHDLSVVKFMSDMMAVMKNGRFVEFGPSECIYKDPKNEYTRELIRSIPNVNIEQIKSRQNSQI